MTSRGSVENGEGDGPRRSADGFPRANLGAFFERPVFFLHAFIKLNLIIAVPGYGEDTPSESQKARKENSDPLATWVPASLDETRSKWAFGFSVGIIGDTTPGDYLAFDFDRLDGPGSGFTYNVTAAYRLHAFNWKVGQRRLQPEIELPFMLTLVAQDDGNVIPDLNGGVMVRWRDFPWNRYVYTTFAIGAGLSYSFRVWEADYARHPGEERSNLKFWMPIEFTLAHPRYPRHQLTAFIDHQSGGTIFDEGGVDAWGFGYRFLY